MLHRSAFWGILCGVLAAASSAPAATYTWNLPGNGDWANPSSWNPATGTPNAAGDVAAFGSAVTGPAIVNVAGGNRTVASITFNNADGAYTITSSDGSRIVMQTVSGNGSIVLPNTTNQQDQRISAAIQLAGGTSSMLDVTTSHATRTLTIDGGISSVSGTRRINKLGIGTLVLSGPNTLSGGLNAFAGTVRATQVNALGSGPILLAGGNLALAADSGMAFTNNVTVGTLNTAVVTADRGTSGSGASHSLGSLTLGSGSSIASSKGANVTSGVGETTFSSSVFTAGPIAVSAGANSALHLGTLTRDAGSVVSFGGSGTITTTTAMPAGGIVGGWATWGTDDWATSSGAGPYPLAALTSYTADTWAAGNNTNATGPSTVASGGTTNSLRFNTSTASELTLGGGSNVIASGGILVGSASAAAGHAIAGPGTLTSGNGQDLVIHANAAAATLRIDAGITNNGATATGLTKTGPGQLILGGPNTYTGATSVWQGKLTLAPGTTLATGAALNIGAGTSAAAVDFGGGGGTFGALTVGGHNVGGSTIQNLDGTLSIASSAAGDVVRIGTAGSYASNVTTKLTVTGNGTLDINLSHANSVLRIAATSLYNPAPAGTAVLDVSGLAHFHASAGTIALGDGNSTNSFGALFPTLVLSRTDNHLTAGTLNVGAGSNSTSVGSLELGQSNVLNIDTITIGRVKAGGDISFQTGLTDPSVVIRGKAGGTSAANLTVAYKDVATAAFAVSTFDMTAAGGSRGILDARFGNLVVGGTTAAGSSGSTTGAFSFDHPDSVVVVNNLTVGQNGQTLVTGNSVTGTLSMGGGSLTVNGSFVLAAQSSTGLATGTLNLTGGTLTSNVDLTDGAGASTLNVAGGTLDMTGHAIGSASAPINTVTFASGGLANIAEINGGVGLQKTGGGTLTLTGANTYTGGTNIGGGTLQVGNGGAAGSLGAGTVNLVAGTTLAFNQDADLTVANTIAGSGAVQQNGSGTVYFNGPVGAASIAVAPTAGLGGSGTISAATVTIQGTHAPGNSIAQQTINGQYTLAGSGTLSIELDGDGDVAGTNNDQVIVNGAVVINGGLDLVFGSGYTHVAGREFLLLDNDLNDAIGGGLFAGLTEGGAFLDEGREFTISYTAGSGNDIAITAVPEPSTLAALASGGLVAAWLWRRQRPGRAAA